MIWIILGSVLGGLLILLFVATYIIYRVIYFSPKKGQNDEMRAEPSIDYQGMRPKSIELITKMTSLPYEDVYMKSRDGLKLHGYFYKNENSNDFILMFNGYRGTPRRDFSGGALLAIDLGKNVLLIDQRAHGRSEGHSITFGRKEQYDVVEWIKFAREKWGKSIKITIVGISMGGATVLMASDKIDPSINVIADCPYSVEKDVIKNSMKKLGFPPALFWPLAYLAAIVFAHASLKDDARINISNSKSKILIIHGTGDTIVPIEMSERVFPGNEDHVQYEKFEGAEHALSYLREPDRYKEIIKNFIEKN